MTEDELILSLCREAFALITDRVLSLCRLFGDRKYLSGLDDLHALLRGQPWYCQSSLPYKSFRQNREYRYLQFLRPCFTPTNIVTRINQEIKPKGGEKG